MKAFSILTRGKSKNGSCYVTYAAVQFIPSKPYRYGNRFVFSYYEVLDYYNSMTYTTPKFHIFRG